MNNESGFLAVQHIIAAGGTRDLDWFRDQFPATVRFDLSPGDSISALGGTFTRSSSATYTDASGVIRTAASHALTADFG